MDPIADIESLLWYFGHQLPADLQPEFYQAAESAWAACSASGQV